VPARQRSDCVIYSARILLKRCNVIGSCNCPITNCLINAKIGHLSTNQNQQLPLLIIFILKLLVNLSISSDGVWPIIDQSERAHLYIHLHNCTECINVTKKEFEIVALTTEWRKVAVLLLVELVAIAKYIYIHERHITKILVGWDEADRKRQLNMFSILFVHHSFSNSH